MHATRPSTLRLVLAALAVGCAAALGGCATSAPREDASATTQALKKLPRKSSEQRVAVSIYEVTSNLPEIPARGSTEMFKTALVKSGQFRVVERAKLQRGVVMEKQLNAAGQTTGTSSQQPLRGAEYLFQAEITELNAGGKSSSTGVNIAGLQLGGGGNEDMVGLDVSIVDANTGDIVDAVNVRKSIGGSSTSVSGVGSFVAFVMADRGKTASPYTPDVSHQSSRRESLDAALRACIEEATRILASRFDGTARP